MGGLVDRLISIATSDLVSVAVIAAIVFQIVSALGLIVWTRLTGSYDKGSRVVGRRFLARRVALTLVRFPALLLSGILAALRSVLTDCRTIPGYCPKLVGAMLFLIVVFGILLDPVGLMVIDATAKFVLITLAIYATRHAIFGLVIAFARMPRQELEATSYEPDVLVLVPCHNEATVIATLLDNLRKLDYPAAKLRIVVIDDASTDATLDVATAYRDATAFEGAQVEVYHRPPGIGGKGKSAALNGAIERYRFGEIIAVFDADHRPEPDCLRRMVRHYEDSRVGAFMGRCIPWNKSATIISYFVYLEYVVGYRGNMLAREVTGTVPAFGGSNCSVRRELLEDRIGLFKEGCLAEDTELTMSVYEEGFLVRYDATARNYEEATDNLKTYIKQRTRWARGHDQVSRAHSWSTLFSRRMTWRRRLEGFLFLQVYWMPVVYLMGITLTLVDYFVVPVYQIPLWAWAYFMLGPTIEVVAAIAREREPVRTWVSLPLFPAFAGLGMFIAARAAWQELMGKASVWEKTARAGDTAQGASIG